MGDSAREKGYQDVSRASQGIRTQIGNTNFSANGNLPFSPMQQLSEIGNLYRGARSDIDRTTGEQVQTAKTSTAGRMFGQGIKGGSLFNSQINRATSPIRKNALDSISSLNQSKARDTLNVQDRANMMERDLNKYNSQMEATKWGLILRALAAQAQAAGGMDDTTAWDDIFQVINTGANVAGAFV